MAYQLLSTVACPRSLPDCYVRPEKDRPRLEDVVSDDNIPIIDLECSDKNELVNRVRDACRSYGFFQVLNHGLDEELIRKMQGVGREFFQLSSEEKTKHYSDDPFEKMRLSTSFNVRRETVRNWRDYLRLHCHPLEEFVPGWPSNPPTFKDIVSLYCKEVRKLGFVIQGLIFESLGLDNQDMVNVLGEQEQHMAINYYPLCPEPGLTYGLPAHTDPNILTILLLDHEVAGLQVLKNDKWIKVDYHPHTFVVNLGDQIQALSNRKYKSVWHRAVVNSEKERLSVASFLAPCNSAVISAPEKLVGEYTPAVYRSFTYDEYYQMFWSRNPDHEHCLELFKN